VPTTADLNIFKEHIDELIKDHVDEKITEPELREKACKVLIPFLAAYAQTNVHMCREAVNY